MGSLSKIKEVSIILLEKISILQIDTLHHAIYPFTETSGRNFSEDHLFLVVPPIEYHKEVPAIVGTYVIDGYVHI